VINVYTEEEAKEKVCPQAVHMLGMSPLINCMGGRCMAWRRGDSIEKITHLAGGSMGIEYVANDRGYCSLGGKP
jgi:hypothetical protein